MGPHTVRFGLGYRVLRQNLNSLGPLASPPASSSGGIFTFSTSGAWTTGPLNTSAAAPIGEDFAEFLYGLPTSGTYAIPATYAEQTKTLSAYVEDDWKISTKLTLSVGLRYELPGGLTERYNRSVASFAWTTANPIAAQAIANYAANPIAQIPASQFRVNGGLTFAGVNGVPAALWATPKTDFMPRFGLAYQITPQTVLRGGYGLFEAPIGVVSTSVNQTGFSQTTTMVPTVDNIHYVASLSNPFPTGLIPELRRYQRAVDGSRHQHHREQPDPPDALHGTVPGSCATHLTGASGLGSLLCRRSCHSPAPDPQL